MMTGLSRRSAERGFTLLEILIVISIIAILAVIAIPNFIGFDVEAKVTTTKSNLNTLRVRVNLFRAREGAYPKSLNDLLTTTYDDMGVKKPYLKEMPPELISANEADGSAVLDTVSTKPLTNKGGWAYLVDKAEVVVNLSDPLDARWGKNEGQIPSKW